MVLYEIVFSEGAVKDLYIFNLNYFLCPIRNSLIRNS